MTSEVEPAGAAGYSSSFAAYFFATVFFAPGVVRFFAAMFLVNGLGIRRGARIIEPGSFHHGAQVVEGDATVELEHRPLDHLLELRGVERSGTGQREQMAPCLRGKAATLVGPKNANGHISSCSHHRRISRSLRPTASLRFVRHRKGGVGSLVGPPPMTVAARAAEEAGAEANGDNHSKVVAASTGSAKTSAA